MTSERAEPMDRAPRWTAGTAEAAGKPASAAHGFPGTPPNANIHNVLRVHLGNVGSCVIYTVQTLST